MSVLDAFLTSAADHGERVAIVDGAGKSISYGALAARAETLAGRFRRKGIRRGDRVLLAMPLGIDLYGSLAALWWLGATIVFPEPALGLKGLRHAARTTRPRAFLASGPYRLLRYCVPEIWNIELALSPGAGGAGTEVEKPVPLSGDDPALISFTSGSTGQPKAIVRSHGFLLAQNAAVSPLLRSESGTERDLVAFPVFVLVNLGLGLTSVLPNWNLKRPDKAAASEIRAHIAKQAVTRLLIPPVLCEALCEVEDLSGVHSIFTGGGPLYPDIARRLRDRFPDVSLTIVYGSTEAEPIAHVSTTEMQDEDWQAMQTGGGLLAGEPVPVVQVRLVGDEIVVNGDHVNKGYLDPDQDVTTKLALDGEVWHRTGDAGRFDDEGRLWLLGRCQDSFDGHYPFSIEIAARIWPGVRRAALCRVKDEAVIAIEGDQRHIDAWREHASSLGIDTVRRIEAMPLDKRHRSKIDMIALTQMLS